MRKGISPLIATVLLIAATMSIAGILAYWASNFVGTALPPANSSQTTCQFAGFQFSSCAYANNTISFVLYNFRTISLNGLTATVFDMNNFPAWNNVTLNGTLGAGQFGGYSVNGIPSNFTKIVVTTSMCPNVLQENTCTRS